MGGKRRISIETGVGVGLLCLLVVSPVVIFLMRAPDAETRAIYTCGKAVEGELSAEIVEFIPGTLTLVSSKEGREEIFRIEGVVQNTSETGLQGRFMYRCEIRPPNTVLSVELVPSAAVHTPGATGST